MEPSFWRQRWANGQTGWHRDEVNPNVTRHASKWLGEAKHRIFVPLCGKTLDMRWMAEQGHQVVGVDLADVAVRAFFSERGSTPEIRADGSLERHAADRVTLFVGDFFDLTRAQVGAATAVYDRGALVALPPELREPYVEHLLALAPSGTRMLVLTVAYEQTAVGGPPFSVPDDEVERRFGPTCEIERLETDEGSEAPPRFAEVGIPQIAQSIWLAQKR